VRARHRAMVIGLTVAVAGLIGGPASATTLDHLDRLEAEVRSAADDLVRTDEVLADQRAEEDRGSEREREAVAAYDEARHSLAAAEEVLDATTERVGTLHRILGTEAHRLTLAARALRGVALIPAVTLDRDRETPVVEADILEAYAEELAAIEDAEQGLLVAVEELEHEAEEARVRAEEVRAGARAAAEERAELETVRAERKRTLEAARAAREEVRVALNGLDTIPDEWRRHPMPEWAARLPAHGRDWAPAIDAAAREAGVDPILFAALIWQESQFDPRARSHVGAYGLTQLMPATAVDLGVDRADPAQNLRGGARYIRQRLDEFGGDATLALAAYNAGAGNVRRYGGVPPFPETRNYVVNIAEFRARLAG
jgi:soluble lytic murein transglycosylase-like protein